MRADVLRLREFTGPRPSQWRGVLPPTHSRWRRGERIGSADWLESHQSQKRKLKDGTVRDYHSAPLIFDFVVHREPLSLGGRSANTVWISATDSTPYANSEAETETDACARGAPVRAAEDYRLLDGIDSATSLVSFSAAEVNAWTDEFRHQRIQHEQYFVPYGKAVSCRLMSRTKGYPEHVPIPDDADNRLALSRDMHGWYEGIACEVPIVNLLAGTVEATPSVDSRYKVEVVVQVLDEECKFRVFSRLKPECVETDDPLKVKAYVYVQDPEAFVRCLSFKYEENAARWAKFLETAQTQQGPEIATSSLHLPQPRTQNHNPVAHPTAHDKDDLLFKAISTAASSHPTVIGLQDDHPSKPMPAHGRRLHV